MTALSGKMTSLLIFVLFMLFVGFVLTPLVLAPFGIFAGLSSGFKHFANGWHLGPWFPFFPLWSFSLLFFVLWIVVIVWVYRDAESRGMSGVLWALLVFIGNLIGLLIFLIIRQDHPILEPCCESPSQTAAPSQATAPPGKTAPTGPPAVPPAEIKLTCPSCQKPVEKNFTYCPHCGAPLQQVCKNCGKPVEPAWKACPHCGSQLKAD
jgi:RNA polymerase subunit RPABC4/transcription elongation factor Spt4